MARRYRQEIETATGWTDWIRPAQGGYMIACCDCGLVHELQFKAVKRAPFRDGKTVQFETVRADAIFRARRKPRLTAQRRKETKHAR